MDTSRDILASVAPNGIATVTLNRPAKRNAVTLAMWQRLGTMFAELGARDDVRVAILMGAGGHFCAGADISEFPTVRANAESGRRYEAAGEDALLAIRDCPKPTIAAVSGYGIGGGCGLALACDFRVGDATTRMGITAARLGIVYGTVDCALLLRQVGLSHAKRVLFSGRHFGIDECAAMRLVDIVASGTALEGAHTFASELSANAPLSVVGAKLVLESLATGSAVAREAEIAAVIDRAMDSADYREGAQAFLTKRKPVFTGQ